MLGLLVAAFAGSTTWKSVAASNAARANRIMRCGFMMCRFEIIVVRDTPPANPDCRRFPSANGATRHRVS